MDAPTDMRTDPLAPIEFVLTSLAGFIALILAIAIPATIFGSGSVAGIGEREACAVVDTGMVPYGGTDDGTGRVSGVQGLAEHTSSWPRTVEICNQDPSWGVKAAATASPVAEMLLLFGFLALALRLVRGARRRGPFTREIAGHTRMIGWFLLVGGLVRAAADAMSDGVVVDSAVADVSWTAGILRFDAPWTVLIAAVGIVSFARVLRQAVMLKDDVDATI